MANYPKKRYNNLTLLNSSTENDNNPNLQYHKLKYNYEEVNRQNKLLLIDNNKLLKTIKELESKVDFFNKLISLDIDYRHDNIHSDVPYESTTDELLLRKNKKILTLEKIISAQRKNNDILETNLKIINNKYNILKDESIKQIHNYQIYHTDDTNNDNDNIEYSRILFDCTFNMLCVLDNVPINHVGISEHYNHKLKNKKI